MILGIDFMQIFLHLFNIIILFGGLYYLVYKPVTAFMDKRDAKYKDMNDKWEQNLRDAEDLRDKYEKALKGADDEIAAKKAEAEAEIAELKKSETEAARAEAAKIIEDAKAEGERRKAGIVDGAKGDITRMIEEAARKIMDADDNASAFDSFLNETEKQSAGGKV
ncbi:MAG: ATP synthase F0 subunit B [Lachnospiraceae bacterium]|nr:ATP synthase F0 subunit B [Lachnospiraceae bacterium]MCR5389695.1 ATP synthase F0 subunit B [Lachnospiraceae bacterium]